MRSSHSLVIAAFAALLTPAAVSAQSAQPCPATAEALAVGTKLQCVCNAAAMAGDRPGRGQRRQADVEVTVFGIDRYAATSDVCRAARHAGAAPPAGGTVSLVVGDGCGEFASAARHGVLSGRAGASTKSFGFGDALATCPRPAASAAPPAPTTPPTTTQPAATPPAATPPVAAAPPAAPTPPATPAPAPSAPAPSTDAFKRLADLGVKAGGQPVTADNAATVLNVYVSGDIAKKFSDADCAALTALPKLGSLSIQGATFTAACATSLAGIKSLTQLSLNGSAVADDALAPLAGTGLRSLSLYLVTAMTDAGLAHVGKMAALQRLNLERAPVGDAGMAHIAALPALEWLSVAQTAVSTAGMAEIAKLPALIELAARGLSMPDDALAALASGAKKLQRLQVSHSKTLTPASVAHIAKLSELRQLELWNGKFGGGLAPLAALKKLEELITSGSNITDADLVEVAKIASLKNYVSYGDPGITDKGLAALGGMTGLVDINLGKTKITDAGLAALKGMTGLRRLNLPETAISDAGIEALAGLKLTAIDLRATAVTDAGLAALLKIESLSSINVMQTKVTAEAVAAAKAARSSVYVAR